MQKETKFKEQVQKDLKSIPRSWFVKTQERSRRGMPDIIGCVSGTFVAIELKVGGNTATPLQEVYLDRISSAGGVSFVATPESWNLQFQLLLGLGNG